MSSTNKTTNYELSQFLGTDKPAWLSDYNSDMGKIDAGIYTAQSTATGADGKADTNATSIGTLANLTTTAKTSLVAAINEVDANADTAQTTANTAANTATQANTKATNLQTFFNLTGSQNLTVTTDKGSLAAESKINSAHNSDGSLGKIYGNIAVDLSNQTGTLTVTIANTGLHPSESITIDALAIKFVYANGAFNYSSDAKVVIATDGTATIQAELNNIVTKIHFLLPPCLLFMTDFGD